MKRELEKLEETYLETYAFDEAVTERIRNVWERSSCPVFHPLDNSLPAQRWIGEWLAPVMVLLLMKHHYQGDAMGITLFQTVLWGIALWGIITLPYMDDMWQSALGLQLSPEGIALWHRTCTRKWKVYAAIRNIIICVLLFYTDNGILYQIWGVYTAIYITAFHQISRATSKSLMGENDDKIPWLSPYSFRKHY